MILMSETIEPMNQLNDLSNRWIEGYLHGCRLSKSVAMEMKDHALDSENKLIDQIINRIQDLEKRAMAEMPTQVSSLT